MRNCSPVEAEVQGPEHHMNDALHRHAPGLRKLRQLAPQVVEQGLWNMNEVWCSTEGSDW